MSASLLLQMSLKEPECFFHVGSRVYGVDFTHMVQTNVDTWFHRSVRRRPFYRSPDSMRPHLQSVSLFLRVSVSSRTMETVSEEF